MKAEDFKMAMLTFTNPLDRDIYLMQKFLTTILAHREYKLASRFFPEPATVDADEVAKAEKKREKLLGKTKVTIFMRLMIAILPLWIIFCIVYIFLRGILLGPQKSRKWLTAYFMTLVNRVRQLCCKSYTTPLSTLFFSQFFRICFCFSVILAAALPAAG